MEGYNSHSFRQALVYIGKMRNFGPRLDYFRKSYWGRQNKNKLRTNLWESYWGRQNEKLDHFLKKSIVMEKNKI